jgi:hypothetical protein
VTTLLTTPASKATPRSGFGGSPCHDPAGAEVKAKKNSAPLTTCYEQNLAILVAF